MLVENKKVKQAIKKLHELKLENVYELRTENTVTHRTNKKYILYAPVLNGLGKTNMYGAYINSFDTQNEFVKWVDEFKEDIETARLECISFVGEINNI